MATLITVLGGIVAAAVAAIVGTFAYRSQKETDRRAELRKQQRTAYENYFQSYFDWAMTEAGTSEEEENANKYKQAYFMLFTLASDNFLEAAMAFHTFVWEQPYPDFTKEADRNRVSELWTDLLLEIRNDAKLEPHVENRLTKNDIEQHLSIW